MSTLLEEDDWIIIYNLFTNSTEDDELRIYGTAPLLLVRLGFIVF